MHAATERPGRHIIALDGVRGIAVAAVLVVHSFPDLTPEWHGGQWIRSLTAAGAFGVDLFFVLSGFLITGILLTNVGTPHYFRNFYARRILRLFPLYYLYLLIVMLVVPRIHTLIGTSMGDYSGSWTWYFLYLSNWKPNFGATDPYLGHFWSLAIEEQFYVVWPAVVFLCDRRWLVSVCVGLILSATALRIAWSGDAVYWNQIYRLTPSRWDTIAMGALAALALRSHTWRPIASRASVILMTAGFCGFGSIALFAGTAEWTAWPIQTIGSSFANICFAGLVVYAATAQRGQLYSCLRHPFLTSLGRYSYCLYVVHIVVIQHMYWLLGYLLMRTPDAVSAVTLKLAFFVGANGVCYYLAKLSWNVFESPILALKERFGTSHDVRQHHANKQLELPRPGFEN